MNIAFPYIQVGFNHGANNSEGSVLIFGFSWDGGASESEKTAIQAGITQAVKSYLNTVGEVGFSVRTDTTSTSV